ncbi:hypothetical protein KUTeg_011841 [Tegillarca granosa]|uniref:RING-type domain-containing protein n=1 Tax=Tegillarca granosa TaxID=220873 RepID=A0ABQ9F092_TEGGR|nr:hypothetical protein KUTeg_011841 [Tegillarca granosa]
MTSTLFHSSYTGKEDVVFCYHCGQGLKSWDPDDNVWVEHARWAPHYLNSLLQTIAAESLILNGYSKELVGKSIRIFLVKEGRENFNSTDLMKILLQLEDDQQVEAKSLIEENRQLKEQTLCKICLDESVSMVFLPCGHLCCCSQCAPALRKCPICRVFVRGTVKTYLN